MKRLQVMSNETPPPLPMPLKRLSPGGRDLTKLLLYSLNCLEPTGHHNSIEKVSFDLN